MDLPRFHENKDIAPLTTLGVGGVAKEFCTVSSDAELSAAIQRAKESNFQVYILGGGSNLLIADEGLAGCVIQIANKGIEMVLDTKDRGVLRVAAGESWDELVTYAVKNNLAGIECLSGIPGCVGAAPIQNIGAYGQEVSSVITQVEAVDVHTQQSESFSAEQCCFSYRNSIFKEQWLGKKVITHVTFSLVKKTHGEVHYKDLIQYFKKHPQEQTLSAIRNAVLEIRSSKSMVLNTSDPNGKSAGSFFTNPILTAEQAQALKKKAGETLPLYAYGEGHKTSAAWLIENSGFHKGFKLGNAALSSKHTLALINPGNATAQDLIALAQKIQKTVDEKWGIRLIPEPQFWGFEKHPLA